MNDILPPKRPLPQVPTDHLLDEPDEPPVPLLEAPKKSRKKFVWWILGSVVAFMVVLILAAASWYELSLRAVSASDTSRTRVRIVIGDSPSQIGQALADKKLIRNALAFDIYTRTSGVRDKLQAGVYSLSPSESMKEIVDHIVSGRVDQFSIRFLPGATLAENRAALIKAGYTVAEVDTALKKTYDSPLFAGKPAGADLEGYIYGETYNFDSSATVGQILEKTFETYYQAVRDADLVNGFKRQGLTLYQGIIMASIIQREVPDSADQKQVAQIFLKRYRMGMPLGSDVTAYYGADKVGAKRSVAVDTPYNTRIHKGLPPGPIGTPGLTALQAVANPAPGDYLFFLSGDDDVTYYARTDKEHEANIRDHCKIKCAIE